MCTSQMDCIEFETHEAKRSIQLDVTPYIGIIQWAYLQPIITQYFIDNKSEIWLLFLIAHSKR